MTESRRPIRRALALAALVLSLAACDTAPPPTSARADIEGAWRARLAAMPDSVLRHPAFAAAPPTRIEVMYLASTVEEEGPAFGGRRSAIGFGRADYRPRGHGVYVAARGNSAEEIRVAPDLETALYPDRVPRKVPSIFRRPYDTDVESVAALGGLLNLGYVMKRGNELLAETALAIERTEGRLFPIAVGNRASVTLLYEIPNSTVRTTVSFEVAAKHDGYRAQDLEVEGDVFEVRMSSKTTRLTGGKMTLDAGWTSFYSAKYAYVVGQVAEKEFQIGSGAGTPSATSKNRSQQFAALIVPRDASPDLKAAEAELKANLPAVRARIGAEYLDPRERIYRAEIADANAKAATEKLACLKASAGMAIGKSVLSMGLKYFAETSDNPLVKIGAKVAREAIDRSGPEC